MASGQSVVRILIVFVFAELLFCWHLDFELSVSIKIICYMLFLASA